MYIIQAIAFILYQSHQSTSFNHLYNYLLYKLRLYSLQSPLNDHIYTILDTQGFLPLLLSITFTKQPPSFPIL